MQAAQLNIKLTEEWSASRYASPVRMALCLVLTYVDPDRVLDTMMFRKELPLYESHSEQVIEMHWKSLAYYAEEYVRNQQLVAYERMAAWA